MLLPFVFSLLFAFTKTQAGNEAGAEIPAVSSTVNKNALLQLVNNVRKTGCQCGDTWYPGTNALNWNDQLENAARDHSRDMSANRYFSHDGKDGSDPGDRITKAGYHWRTYAENIGLGYQTEQEVIAAWLKSPGHCKNIMGAKYTEMGVARAGGYWTMNLATK